MTWIIIVGGIILIVLLIIGVIVSSNSERDLVEERLSQYLDDGDKQDIDREAQKYALTNWVSSRVEKTSFGDRIARELARADIKFKVAEYFALIIMSIVLVGAIAWFLGNRYLVSGLIGAIIGGIIWVRENKDSSGGDQPINIAGTTPTTNMTGQGPAYDPQPQVPQDPPPQTDPGPGPKPTATGTSKPKPKDAGADPAQDAQSPMPTWPLPMPSGMPPIPTFPFPIPVWPPPAPSQ